MSKQVRGTYISEMGSEHLSDQKAQETLKLMLSENNRLHDRDAQKKQTNKNRFLHYAPVFAAAAACIVIAITLIHPNQSANTRAGKRIEYGSIQLSSLPSGIVTRGEAGNDLEAAFGISGENLFTNWSIIYTAVYSSGEHKQAFVELERDGVNLTASVSDMESALYNALKETNAGPAGVRFNCDPLTNELSAVYRYSNLWIVISSDNVDKTEFETIISELNK